MAADDRMTDDRAGAGAGATARRLDEVAVARAVRRIVAAPELPWLHAEVARRLGERLLPMRATPTRMIDWWAGVGGGAATLKTAYPRAERVAVEPRVAAAEIEARDRSARRWWSWPRGAPATALYDDGDGAHDAAIGRAQLVWSNMSLHLVRDPPALFARWHRLLDVEGVVVFSCPGPATLGELRALYAECGWPAPTPDFVDMHDLGDMLVHAGFADPVLDQETLTLRWQSPQALLAELHTLGGNTSPGRAAGLRTPAWRRRLVDALAARADADGGISLGIEVAYGHGFKAAPRPSAGEPFAVPLDDMRTMLRQPRVR